MSRELLAWRPGAEPFAVVPSFPVFRYHAVSDKLYRGVWSVEPVDYVGRGCLYYFRGRGARQAAQAWAEIKNRECGKVKLKHWQTALSNYILAARNEPFSFDPQAGLDCCRFTFGAIRVQTGLDIGLQFAGAWKTQREALECMRKYCGKASLVIAITKLMQEHGCGIVPAMYAQPGDAIIVPQSDSSEFLGILDLNGKDVVSVGLEGLRRVPISIRCRAWRIS